MESKDEKIGNLKALIEETKKKIESKTSSLNDISKKLSLKKEEARLAEEHLRKLQPYRILTKKEIRAFAEKELEEKRHEFEWEKANINILTEKAFEKARRMRLDVSEKSEHEKYAAEKSALELEISALKKEVNILDCILDEKSRTYEDLLAEKMCEQCNLKRMSFHKNFQTCKNSEVNSVKSRIKCLTESCLSIRKEIMNLNFKIRKSSDKFYLKLSELSSL